MFKLTFEFSTKNVDKPSRSVREFVCHCDTFGQAVPAFLSNSREKVSTSRKQDGDSSAFPEEVDRRGVIEDR